MRRAMGFTLINHMIFLQIMAVGVGCAGEGVEKLEPSYAAGGNVKWGGHSATDLATPPKVKPSHHMSQEPYF